MSAKEYREYADECMHSAKNSTLVKECREFLQTAEAWLQAADLLEAEPRRTVVVRPSSKSRSSGRGVLEQNSLHSLVRGMKDVGRKRLPAICWVVSARRMHNR
jgi:hypothetical protein